MKKGLLILTVAILFLVSCAPIPSQGISEVDNSSQEELYQVEESGSGSHLQDSSTAGFVTSEEGSPFTEGEISGIIFMREEEKLARDVYLLLADLWGMNIFENIAGSEDTHMGAVLTLIEMAGIEDPVEGLGQGDFLNQDLQQLYYDLTTRGEESLAEALLVGAAIEEIDILDLQMYLAETEDESIKEVYQNLLKGSINHLNSFVRTYERQTGDEYLPQFLSEDAYQELLSVASQGGGGNGQGRSDQPQGKGQAN